MLTHFPSNQVASSQLLHAAPFSAKVRTKLNQLCRKETSDPKENTPFVVMNKGSFFLMPSKILLCESWTTAALNVEPTTEGNFFSLMMTNTYDEI